MTNPNKLESGTIFGATYKIIDFIGEGGMGLVYKVEHLLLSKLLALKILKTENLTEAVWKRFRAEGQAIARLDHSNIVRIYDMSQSEDGVPFYTMDLLIGQSLADYLQENRRLTEAEALPIFRQVSAGLAYAHERGIIHRDIKPGNIMLIDRAEADKTEAVDISKKLVKIVDFGIAKLTDERGNTIQGLTKPGEVFGSPLYMSPEQCNGQKVDQRSDLYSVGITLFQALTGKPPLLGKTAIETTIMHQTTKPARLNDLSDQVEYSPRLEALVAKMLEKRPQDRYSSLAEVAKELLEIERSEEKEKGVGLRKVPAMVPNKHIDLQEDSQTISKPQSIFSTNNIVAFTAIATMLAAAGIAITIIVGTEAKDKQKQAQIIQAKIEEKEEADQVRRAWNLPPEPEIKKRQISTILQPVLNQATNDAVKAFLQSNENKFSQSKLVASKKQLTFNFPQDFSLGKLVCLGEHNDISETQAQRQVIVPEMTLRRLHCNDVVRAYPQLLTYFAPGDLWSLIFEGQSSNPELLVTSIGEMKDLHILSLTRTILPDDKLTSLDALKSLQTLGLANTQFNSTSLSKCQFLGHLQSLDLENGEKLLPLLEKLKQSNHLDSLVLSKCALDNDEIKAVSEMTKLKKLTLSKSKVSNNDLKQLTSLSRLEELNLEKCSNLDSSCLQSLKTWPRLSTLKLSPGLLSAAQIKELQDLQRQRYIELNVSNN